MLSSAARGFDDFRVRTDMDMIDEFTTFDLGTMCSFLHRYLNVELIDNHNHIHRLY
jgi:hypothetical protein